MLARMPAIAVWTDEGRNDRAASVDIAATESGALQVAVEAPSAAVSFVALRWEWDTPAGARVLGDHWERGYGDLEWRGVVPERPLPWYALVHHPKKGDTHGFGVETGAGAICSWRVDEKGITLLLDLRSGGLGVRLGSRRLNAATVQALTASAGESPFAFARRFCAVLCPAPLLPKQPVYGGNDWYFRYGKISADTVRHDSGLIRDLSPVSANLPFYVIDAGWYADRDGYRGPYDRGNSGFPDMSGLAEELRRQEIRPGIWIRPLLTGADVPDSWKLPADRPHELAGEGAYLDPSVPDVLDLVRADIARLRGWGYELIKHDFTTFDSLGRWGRDMGPLIAPGGWSFADRSRTTAEIIRDLYQAIRDAAGDALIIGCNTIGHLGAGLFELQRTGDDTSGKYWERTRRIGVNTVAFRMPQQGAFFAADADCVGLTDKVPWEQNRQWLDLLSKSGTPLFVSADPAAVGPEQRAALKEAFARASEPMPPAEPLDWMETTCPRRWRTADGDFAYDWEYFPGSSFACPI